MINKILHSKKENFEDTKDEIRSRKIKKDKTMQWPTKLYEETNNAPENTIQKTKASNVNHIQMTFSLVFM